jgi:hypothetical protein
MAISIPNYEIPIRKYLLEKLTDFSSVRIYAGINTGDAYFPAVIVTQVAANLVDANYDSAGWHNVKYAIDINVYTNGESSRAKNTEICDTIAQAMQEIGFSMDSQNANLGDTVQKYERAVMRFTAILNTNTNETYRG